MLPIPSTICRLHRNAAPKSLVQGKEKNKKKKSENEKKLLAFQCQEMKDWFSCA